MRLARLLPLLALTASTLRAITLGAQPATPDSLLVRQRYEKRELRITMRDGIRLHTVAYIPRDASPTRRYPILLQRTPFSAGPYGDSAYAPFVGPNREMLREGYIFVNQEVRGRYLSEGEFENVRPLLSPAERARRPRATDESTDAFDTIAWLLRTLPSHNGKVGLVGISYGGYYAAAAALSRHPAIAALSLQAPVMDFYFEDFRRNGALVQGSFYAYPVFGERRAAPTTQNWWLPAYQRVASRGMPDDYAFQRAIGSIANVTRDVYAGNDWWRQVVGHPDYDHFWQARAMPAKLRALTAPTLVVGGWFDAENLHGTLAAYRALRAQSPASALTLVMGPFGHRDWTQRDVAQTVHGHLHFGDSLAAHYQRDVEAPFFRAHLKGAATTPTGALMFDTGRKQWARFSRWPAPSSASRVFHLNGSGIASRAGTPRTFREFISDPLDPVPSRCTGPTIEDGALDAYMSDDQRCASARADVVTFQSEPLTEDIVFAGPISARIVLSTTAADADVVVKLIDVFPTDEPNHRWQRDSSVRMAGYQQLVRGEIMRARYRHTFRTPTPMRAGEATPITVELPDVFHTFRRGHRLMVQVHGSWFPLFDRNPQRWVPDIFTAADADFTRATMRVWSGGAEGSRLVARVLP